jgi:branched-chain amino acid transport system permease protein
MRDRTRFIVLWAVVLGAGGMAVAALGQYGLNVVAFGLLYAVLATSWSLLRATGLFSFGQAAFFGTGALTQAWLVTIGQISPWLAFAAARWPAPRSRFP